MAAHLAINQLVDTLGDQTYQVHRACHKVTILYSKISEKVIKISQNDNLKKQNYLQQIFDEATIVVLLQVNKF